MIFSRSDLLAQRQQGASLQYLPFWSHHPEQPGEVDQSCLSMWYPTPFLTAEGVFPNVEQWLMLRKAQLYEDTKREALIRNARTASEARQLGRAVGTENPGRWHEARLELAIQGNWNKFSQTPALGTFLLATDPYVLVQASPIDAFWGTGLKADDPRLPRPDQWPGENWLGFVLMHVRQKLGQGHRAD